MAFFLGVDDVFGLVAAADFFSWQRGSVGFYRDGRLGSNIKAATYGGGVYWVRRKLVRFHRMVCAVGVLTWVVWYFVTEGVSGVVVLDRF